MDKEVAIKHLMVLDIKTNPIIPPETYSAIERAFNLIYQVGYDSGRHQFLENQITHPIGIVNGVGTVLREFPSLKEASHYTKDGKVTIINAIKEKRKTRRGFRYTYLTERKCYKQGNKSIKGISNSCKEEIILNSKIVSDSKIDVLQNINRSRH